MRPPSPLNHSRLFVCLEELVFEAQTDLHHETVESVDMKQPAVGGYVVPQWIDANEYSVPGQRAIRSHENSFSVLLVQRFTCCSLTYTV